MRIQACQGAVYGKLGTIEKEGPCQNQNVNRKESWQRTRDSTTLGNKDSR